jgi:adenylate kinase
MMDKGSLVSDSVVWEMLSERIAQSDCAKGYLLDGFPRNREQAEFLDAHLSMSGGSKRNCHPLVVRLVVSRKSLLHRLAGRQTCPSCGAGYSTYLKPPDIAGRCDIDGSSLVVREDDREQITLERHRIYEERISPIMQHYAKHEAVLEIDGDRPVEQITKDILRQLKETHHMKGRIWVERRS